MPTSREPVASIRPTRGALRSAAVAVLLAGTALIPATAAGATDGVSLLAGETTVEFSVAPSLLLVVGSDGKLAEVWSNTPHPEMARLSVRTGAVDGPLTQASDTALRDYGAVASGIDWAHAPGRVYARPQSGPTGWNALLSLLPRLF